MSKSEAPAGVAGPAGEGRASRTVKRVAVAFLLALALGYVPHQVYGRSGLARLFALRRTVGELRRSNEAARVENLRLREQAAALKNDPRAIERVARDELGLVGRGETVYEVQSGGKAP
jgi:cell division protein FtsB